MKCKKPNCDGVVEIGVCTKCGAESGPSAASEETKSEGKAKVNSVKEQDTVKSKSSAEARHKTAGAGDLKAPTAPEAEPSEKSTGKDKPSTVIEQSSAKHFEKKDGHKTEPKESASQESAHKHKDAQEKKDGERKRGSEQKKEVGQIETDAKSESEVQNEGGHKEVDAKSKQTEAKKGHEEKTTPEQKGTEQKASAHKVSASERSEHKKSGDKVAAEDGEHDRRKSKEPGKVETAAKAERKQDSSPPDVKPESEATGLAGLVAKRSPTEERKRIESTIPNSVVPAPLPAPAEEKLNFKDVNLEDTAAYRNIIETVKSMLEPREVAPSREDLYLASRALRHVMPYNFDAWRLHADLLLTAIHQLETRQLQPDPNFTLMAIPLREDDLRDAAEQALRECAHFAESEKLKIQLIDEANSVRRITWF